VFRRIGSTLSQDLEVVAGVKLRDVLDLKTGSPVRLDIDGAWL